MAASRRGGQRPRRTTEPSADPPREHWRADGRPKHRFATQAEANRSSLRLRLEEGADLDPYCCGICGGWHLGNKAG
jgi:hypothetical protein